MTSKYKYFILTGEPGVGKTTLTKKLWNALSIQGIQASGFYTEEVRNNRTRVGFDVVTLEGERGKLARDQSLLNGNVKHQVGKYGVLVQEFENIALPSLRKPESQLLVIDEIGKMEFFSEPFKLKIIDLFNEASSSVILATIPVRKSHPLIESIRNGNNSKVWMITKENRNNIYEDILKTMKVVFNLN